MPTGQNLDFQAWCVYMDRQGLYRLSEFVRTHTTSSTAIPSASSRFSSQYPDIKPTVSAISSIPYQTEEFSSRAKVDL